MICVKSERPRFSKDDLAVLGGHCLHNMTVSLNKASTCLLLGTVEKHLTCTKLYLQSGVSKEALAFRAFGTVGVGGECLMLGIGDYVSVYRNV